METENLITPKEVSAPTVTSENIVEVAASSADWLSAATKRISILCGLSDGWDEGAGKRAQREAIACATAILQQEAINNVPQPGIFLTTEGGFSFQWSEENKGLELDIAPNGEEISYFLRQSEKPDQSSSIQLSSNGWPRLIDLFQLLGSKT